MNPNRSTRLIQILTFLTLVTVAVVPLHGSAQIAITGISNTGSSSPDSTIPSLELFIEQVKTSSIEQITGLYVENLFSFPVIQQPSDQPANVSPNDDLVTQFSSASAFGSLGFLAHNNLAGIKFPEIKNGDLISVVFGDGHFTQYQVTQIRRLQAVRPTDPYSSFLDLSNNQILIPLFAGKPDTQD